MESEVRCSYSFWVSKPGNTGTGSLGVEYFRRRYGGCSSAEKKIWIATKLTPAEEIKTGEQSHRLLPDRGRAALTRGRAPADATKTDQWCALLGVAVGKESLREAQLKTP